MQKMNSRRRHFAIKATMAKREDESGLNNKEVVFFGRRIPVTKDNATLVEFALQADAQAAYAVASERAARRNARAA